jgi:predicted transposase/invertase (TIGR01784 family)
MAEPFETRPAAEAAASEPPIREFADRGTLWLLESPENLRGLVQLVAKDIADRLDFSRAQRVNRSFIPDDLHKQEADLLFLVPLREGRGEVWVYVLLEHQSRPDRTMGLRLLSYIVQLWEMQRRGFQDERTPMSRWRLHPVVPIVFYTGKRRWSSPISVAALMDVPPLLERFVPRFDTLFLNLQETPPDVLTQAESAIALALRALQASDEPREALAEVLEEVVTRLEALPESAQAELRRALEYLFLLVHHRRDPEEQDELSEIMVSSVERLREEAEDIAMTNAQVLIGRGRREGDHR